MQRAKRLFSCTFKAVPSRAWCVFAQAVKPQHSARVEKSSKPENKFLSIDASKPHYRNPRSGRFVSKDFFELLKQCVDSDQVLRFINGEIDTNHKKYASLLKNASANAGKVERLGPRAGHATPAQTVTEETQAKKILVERLGVLNNAKGAVPKVTKRRRTSFRKLYRVAQTNLDRSLHVYAEGYRVIPAQFFPQKQEMLDCHRADQVQKTFTKTLRGQLIEKNKELHALDASDQVDSGRITILQNEREELSKKYCAAQFESNVRESNMRERERDLVNTIWPYVASEADMFGRLAANVSEVSRGDKHEPMKEDLPQAVESVPSDRDDLIRARDMASELLRAKVARHDRLAWRYFMDLESYLQEDPIHTRLQFDRQFVEDRTQAMKEVAIAESHLKHFNDRLKKEGHRRLQDCTSDFGNITDDGRVSSMGTNVMRDLRRGRELDHPYIEEYISNIDGQNLRNAWSPISPQDHDDSDWNARSIALGDSDTFSKAEHPQTRDKIRRWRKKMDFIRRVAIIERDNRTSRQSIG